LLLLRSILVGILLQISQKAGPTVILFAYIYALHHFVTANGAAGLPLSTGLMLTAAVAVASILVMALKTVIGKVSARADAEILPQLDSWCLRRVLKCDMRLMRIRMTSRALLDFLKTSSLFLLLVLVAFNASMVLAITLLFVLAGVTALTVYLPKKMPSEHDTLLQHAMRPANYAEQLLIIGLLLALAIEASADANLLHSTMLVFVIARFGGALKVFARSIKRLLVSRRLARELKKHDRLAKSQNETLSDVTFEHGQPAE
jgi:hypothetical protein